VKKAVKELYKVDVSKVNITVKHRRAKGLSGRRGISPALRKAVVQVKEGQKIDFV
jgi:ribosomal protein L23